MAYPRELLSENEELSLDLRPHWWYFAKHLMFGFVLLAALIFISFIPEGSSTSATGSTDNLYHVLNRFALLAWSVVAIAWAFIVLSALIKWFYTLFVVTSDRIIYRSGIIAKRGVEIPLERVNNINFSQSMIERIIGAGTLEIESAGEDGQSTFRDVRHPDAVQQEIYRCMEGNVRKTARYASEGFAQVANNQSAPLSIPEQLEKLAQLRDQNIITEAEFLDNKQKLLDQM